ncbi:hypothetical protein [Usitatibacter palustris]|uniref:Uncharacterized protein n=1 Tax=Usitatibacter palustris TaxID=2732487 RepID=A0A6M4HDF8_9PROT|nr:hypothetical protein [Usitatibacter palustris]QJR16027.1 hypothetical protein DSM104440_02855 [Usitatibacter palustris]
MKAKWLFGVAAVASLVAAYALWPWKATDAGATARTTSTAERGVNGSQRSSVEGVSAGSGLVRPSAAGVSVSAPARATISNDFATARTYKALYDRLHNTTEGQTAEGQYILQKILRACATITGRNARQPRAPSDEQRRDYLASLSDKDPSKAKRVAAFEQLAEDKCVGLSGLVTTEAELGQKLKDAAAAGSPAARASIVEQEMWVERRSSDSRRPTLSEGQIDSLKGAFSSKDPEAILAAGRVLSNTFRDVSLRIGPDQANAEGRALMNAFAIAACDYGYACGDNNARILNGCAYQGHCEAGNLPDYIQYYAASPHDAMLQQQYRTALRNAIDTGDWSAITFHRGPTSPTPGFATSGPGPMQGFGRR